MNEKNFDSFYTQDIIADIFESVIGAVYEDGGLDAVH